METSGNFLIDVVTPDVAREIQEQLLMLKRRWEDTGNEARRFVAQENSDRGRREYEDIVERLNAWLAAAESLAGSRNMLPCSHAEVKTHVQQLDVSTGNVHI